MQTTNTDEVCVLLGWGGGGEILPEATLAVNNFFNMKANATKLAEFFRKLSGNNLI